MAERLAGGNVAIALLANTGATVAVLAVLIAVLGPISGAHFNPAVSMTEAARGQLTPLRGNRLHLRASRRLLRWSAIGPRNVRVAAAATVDSRPRSGSAQWLSEVVATAGLSFSSRGECRERRSRVMACCRWIGAAYWFTASTSFMPTPQSRLPAR